MISIISAIIGNTLSSVLGNSLKSMVKSSVLHAKTFKEIICSISKVMVLLITIGVLLASIILLFCFGLNYFLLSSGFTFYQSLAVIIALKIVLIGVCIKKVKSSIEQINQTGEELVAVDQQEHITKPGIVQNTINSFVDGFNSRK